MEDYHQLLAEKTIALSDKLGRKIDYIEVGVCTGNSAEAVLGTGRINRAVLIDNWTMHWPGADIVSVSHRLKEYEGTFEIVSGNSRDVLSKLSKSFDMGFVDGDHEESSCIADMTAMLPLLRVGGVMFVDDMRQTGSKDIWLQRVTEKFASENALTMQLHDVHNGLAELSNGQ